MEFYTFSSQKRPVRLCEQTRQFAARSLAGEYGKAALKTPFVTLDHIAEYEALSSIEKYDAALDICFVPVSMDNENAVQAIMGLCRGFVKLGGYFMQIDTVDRETLLQAQRHPENYSTLSVRVSGWNARFVTLSREWENMIIDRAK